MSEPTIPTANAADLVEQSLDLVPEDEPPQPSELAIEADTADALEQIHEIGFEEEHDQEHDEQE